MMKICSLCNRAHSMQSLCSFQDLAKKIAKLTEANSIIPSLMQANKEATMTALEFQKLVKMAADSQEILDKVLAQYENGSVIKDHYMKELSAWVSQLSKQDTSGQDGSSEPSTSIASVTSLCTNPKSGDPSPDAS